MKLTVSSITENPASVMRRAGYAFQRADGDEMSFIRPLARAGYPRFHCYVKVIKTDLAISFHLDQKKHTYGEDTRHHGEYENDGPVAEEAKRLLAIFGPTAKITQ